MPKTMKTKRQDDDHFYTAARFKRERHYECLQIEPCVGRERPTIQVWFEIELGDHDLVDALLRHMEEVLSCQSQKSI
jgi:hypothetical protein